jgi:hypothetical protein
VPLAITRCTFLEQPLAGEEPVLADGEQDLVAELAPRGTASWRLQPR